MTAIYHEVLHFMFFDFGDSNVPGLKEKETGSGSYWDLSEIFNDVILNSLEFQNALDIEEQRPYPVHENLLPEFEKLWNDCNHDVQKFIETGIERLEKKYLDSDRARDG